MSEVCEMLTTVIYCKCIVWGVSVHCVGCECALCGV